MQHKLRIFKDALWILFFFALIVGTFRMVFGLGATTNLSDEVPWGLWKILNMVAGVALSTSGFTVGFLVYVLKIKKFKPLMKPAILVAFLGYGSSCIALMFDIGLPQRFWHPFLMWNEHSFLFEVFWCVILYFSITFIELIPNIMEKHRGEKIVNFLHKISIVAVIIGISLSSLHHSSLGSLFLTTPTRLHELWFTEWLPWMFITSAMGGGLMFLILVKILYAKSMDPVSVFGTDYLKNSNLACSVNGKIRPRKKRVYGKDMKMLSDLSIIAASLLGIYLLMKIYDLFFLGSFVSLTTGSWESVLFISELSVTTVVPILIIAIKRMRESPVWLGIAAASTSIGVVLNRVNVGIFGYFRDAGVVYWPSFGEWALSIGVVAGATLVFFYISEHYTIFDENWRIRKIQKVSFKATFDSFSRVWTNVLQDGVYRTTLIAVFIIPIAFVILYPPYSEAEANHVNPALGANISRSVLIIDGNGNGKSTEFPHEAHQMRMGNEESCQKCHHLSMPKDNSTSCARCHRDMYKKTAIFDHSNHLGFVAEERNLSGLHPQNKSCNICHRKGAPRRMESSKDCVGCHKTDMKMTSLKGKNTDFMFAGSYMDAMHNNCIPCHEQNPNNNGKNLGDCSTCHKSMSRDDFMKISSN